MNLYDENPDGPQDVPEEILSQYCSNDTEAVYGIDYIGYNEHGDPRVMRAVGSCSFDRGVDRTVIQESAVAHFVSQTDIDPSTVDVISFTWSEMPFVNA